MSGSYKSSNRSIVPSTDAACRHYWSPQRRITAQERMRLGWAGMTDGFLLVPRCSPMVRSGPILACMGCFRDLCPDELAAQHVSPSVKHKALPGETSVLLLYTGPAESRSLLAAPCNDGVG